MKYVNQATIIKSQNELLLLGLLMDYSQLKREDVSRLKEDLPDLKKLIGIIYQAAEQIDGTFNHKSPLWSNVSFRICDKYPGARARLANIEHKLQDARLSGRLLKEILGDLVLVTNTVIEIQFDILRIPIPTPPPVDGPAPLKEEAPAVLDPDEEVPTILDINSLKLIRNSGDFKPPA